MYLANKGIIPPKQYYHYSNLVDINNKSVAYYLVLNGVIPPKEWKAN